MAMDQSALLDLLDALKTADGGELMRRMLAMMLQELIDAEATSVIGAGRMSGPLPVRRSATAPARSCSPPVSGT